MGSYLSQAGAYLLQLVFGLYILAVMLRFLFQWVRADFYNPLSQALVKITNPPLILLRRVIPGFWGIDVAAIVLMMILQTLELLLSGDPGAGIPGLIHGTLLKAPGLVIGAVAALISLATWVMLIAMIIRIVMSWVNPMGGHNPMTSLLHSLTEPMMYRARRLIPPISGLDLSPIAIFVVLQLCIILVVGPLRHLAKTMM